MRTPSMGIAILASLCLACADAQEPAAPGAGPGFGASVGPAPSTIAAPVFGLGTNPDGSLLAAESFIGVTELRQGGTSHVAALFGVTGVAPNGRGDVLVLTGGLNPADADAQKLFRMSRGGMREIADLDAYEHAVNPDQVWNSGPPDSNPFNIAPLNGGKALVADAAANAILIVDETGAVDWVAVLTPQLVSTAPFKALIGCPGSGAPECGLPPSLPAQPVATSIAVGPDGAYYAGELTGFPGTPGTARIWRIAPGSRHVLCPSQACTMLAGGFTSIMDLKFGADGTLYVAEFDAAGWLAVEVVSGGPLAPVAGGTVQACNISTGTCAPMATGLSLPAALAIGKDGRVWVAENHTIPGVAEVHPLN